MNPGLRALTAADLPALLALIDPQPARHCFVEARLGGGSLAGVDLWGYFSDSGRLDSALLVGANVVPIESHAASRAAFADRLRRTGRRGSSLVGPAPEVLDLWRLLEPSWGPAREVRDRQPLLVISAEPAVAADPGVRAVRSDEIDVLLPACIAMFTEEVGVSPVAGGSGSAYRARIAEIVREGRAFARIEDGAVVFKAEIGAVSERACQVQGVWVDPRMRGRGLSVPGMAAVVALSRRTCSPRVSLYVNDFNTAARKAYEKVGFAEVDTFATVLF
ncbi:MAG: GNAT family N-acetyltransferase [bacterium]